MSSEKLHWLGWVGIATLELVALTVSIDGGPTTLVLLTQDRRSGRFNTLRRQDHVPNP